MRAEVLVGPERRRRWTAEQKVRIVGEAFEPGVRVAEVARRRDVSRSQIYQWRAELRDERAADMPGGMVSFVPVELEGPRAARQSTPVASECDQLVEIGLIGGRVLRLPVSLGAAVLRRLIRAVESA